MIKSTLYILGCFLVLSCERSGKSSSKPESTNKQNIQDDAKRQNPKLQHLRHTYIDKSLLKGIWWGDSTDPSAAFEIKTNTIYYPEHFKSYKYQVIMDTMIIYYEDNYIMKSIIRKLDKDSLILLNVEYQKIEEFTRSKE